MSGIDGRIWRILACLAVFSLAVSGGAWGSSRDTAAALSAPEAFVMQELLQDEGGFSLVGRVGGPAVAVVVKGDLAYAGIGSELAVIGISDPTRPTRIGYVDLDVAHIYALALKENTAYVVGWVEYPSNYYLISVDITQPAKPQIRSSILLGPNRIHGLYVEGHTAYLTGTGDGLRIFDLSDPDLPAETGFYDTPGEVYDIFIQDGIAYLANAGNGLLLIDVHSPSSPFEIGRGETNWFATRVIVRGNFAYVIETYPIKPPFDQNVLRIFDISNPASPVTVARFDPGIGTGRLERMLFYETGGSVYLLIPKTNKGLFVLDIMDPYNPSVGYWHPFNWIYDFTIVGDYAYLAGDGLQVYEISAGVELQPVGAYRTPILLERLAAYGNTVYGRSAGKMVLMDVSNPEKPELYSILDEYGYSLVDMIVHDHVLYALYDQSIWAFSLASPSAPEPLGHLEMPERASGFDLDDHFAYILTWGPQPGLLAIDFTDPSAPYTAASYPGIFYDVKVKDGFAYLAADEFQVLDVSDLSDIRLISSLPGEGSRIALKDDYVYYATFIGGGFEIIDVSDPAEPELLDFFAIEGEIDRFHIEENMAFLKIFPINDRGSLAALDLTQPSQPKLVGRLHFSRYFSGMVYNDGWIYVGGDGLHIFKFGSQILGRTLLPNRIPIEGVAISTGGYSTTSGPQGRYKILNLPAGDYTLDARKGDFISWPFQPLVSVPGDIPGMDFYILPAPIRCPLDPGEPSNCSFIDPQGKSTMLIFPAGAAPGSSEVTVSPVMAFPDGGMAFAGHAFDISLDIAGHPGGYDAFSLPVDVTVEFSQSDIAVISDPAGLILQHYQQGSWVDASQTCSPSHPSLVDLDAGFIQVKICQTGLYALFGPTHQVFFPLVGR
jgi:hypothetical protein